MLNKLAKKVFPMLFRTQSGLLKSGKKSVNCFNQSNANPSPYTYICWYLHKCYLYLHGKISFKAFTRNYECNYCCGILNNPQPKLNFCTKLHLILFLKHLQEFLFAVWNRIIRLKDSADFILLSEDHLSLRFIFLPSCCHWRKTVKTSLKLQGIS